MKSTEQSRLESRESNRSGIQGVKKPESRESNRSGIQVSKKQPTDHLKQVTHESTKSPVIGQVYCCFL